MARRTVPPCPPTPLIQVKGRTLSIRTRQAAANAALRNATAVGDIWRLPIVSGASRSRRPLLVETGSFPGIALAQHAVECAEPFAAVRLLRQSFRPQQVTQLRMGADDAERYMTRRQLIMEIEQHPCPSQIDVWGCRKIAGNHADVG